MWLPEIKSFNVGDGVGYVGMPDEDVGWQSGGWVGRNGNEKKKVRKQNFQKEGNIGWRSGCLKIRAVTHLQTMIIGF